MSCWYVSLFNSYSGNLDEVRSIRINNSHCVLELEYEVEPNMVDRYKLIEIGQGSWTDDHIQKQYRKILKRCKT